MGLLRVCPNAKTCKVTMVKCYTALMGLLQVRFNLEAYRVMMIKCYIALMGLLQVGVPPLLLCFPLRWP